MSGILIVDDDQMQRELVSFRLKDQGHTEIATAANGSEAWELLQTQSFDLILLDLMMPIMNGLELLQKMNDHGLSRENPTIVLSAEEDIENVYKCLELGAVDYLVKPVNITLLKSRVDNYVQRRDLRYQSSPASAEDAAAAIAKNFLEPLDNALQSINQMLTQSAGPITDKQADLLRTAQSRLVQVLALLIEKPE